MIMLLSIDLYMRSFKFSDLKEENFNTNRHIMVRKYLVAALNVTFKGKRCHRKGGNTADHAESTSHFEHICHQNLFGDNHCLGVHTHHLQHWDRFHIFPAKNISIFKLGIYDSHINWWAHC